VGLIPLTFQGHELAYGSTTTKGILLRILIMYITIVIANPLRDTLPLFIIRVMSNHLRIALWTLQDHLSSLYS
jgi:hypothetical protein